VGSSVHLLSYAQPEIKLKQIAASINNGHRTLHLKAQVPLVFLARHCDKIELENPGEKRGRRDTHREISSDDAYDKGDEDQPPAKRGKSYEAPALIISTRK